LGNVMTLTSFKRAIAYQVGRNAAEAARLADLAIAAGSRSLSKDDEFDLDDLRSILRLRRSEAWFFENDDHPDKPFEGIDLGVLPCTLGLPYRKDLVVVGFAVATAQIGDCRRPCVYDPTWEFQEFWRPTGRTRPSCSTYQPNQGFPEWIALAPLLEHAEKQVVSAIVTDCLEDGVGGYDIS